MIWCSQRTRGWLAAVVLVSLAGCAGLPGQDRNIPIKSFLLDPPAPAKRQASAQAAAVLVAAPRVSAGYDSPRIVYTKREFQLDYYARNEWAGAPAAMLWPLLIKYLDGTGSVTAITAPPNTQQSVWRLDVQLQELRHVYRDAASEGRATLWAQLSRTDQPGKVATAQLSATHPAASQDPYGGVQAMNAAVADILEQLSVFVQNTAAP